MAAGAPNRCVETVDYDAFSYLFTSLTPLTGGAAIEIAGSYTIQGGAVCHQTRGLAALVVGDGVSDDIAYMHERIAEADYAAIPGGAICYRFADLGGGPGRRRFVADAFIGGEAAPSRTDPRPFEMRAAPTPLASGRTARQ